MGRTTSPHCLRARGPPASLWAAPPPAWPATLLLCRTEPLTGECPSCREAWQRLWTQPQPSSGQARSGWVGRPQNSCRFQPPWFFLSNRKQQGVGSPWPPLTRISPPPQHHQRPQHRFPRVPEGQLLPGPGGRQSWCQQPAPPPQDPGDLLQAPAQVSEAVGGGPPLPPPNSRAAQRIPAARGPLAVKGGGHGGLFPEPPRAAAGAGGCTASRAGQLLSERLAGLPGKLAACFSTPVGSARSRLGARPFVLGLLS